MDRIPNLTGIVALVCIFIAAPLAVSNHSWELVPIVGIGAATTMFWRPVQAWTRRFDSGQEQLADATTTRRLAALEHQVEALQQEQGRLRETVRWQERLLRQTSDDPSLGNGTSTR